MPAAPEPAAAAAAEAAAAEGTKERGGADGDGGEGGGGDAEHGPGDTKKKGKKKTKKKAEGGASGAGGGGVKWPAHPTTVFVRGLGMSATSKDLREAFVGAGPVLEARVVEDKKTGETKARENNVKLPVVCFLSFWVCCLSSCGSFEQAGEDCLRLFFIFFGRRSIDTNWCLAVFLPCFCNRSTGIYLVNCRRCRSTS